MKMDLIGSRSVRDIKIKRYLGIYIFKTVAPSGSKLDIGIFSQINVKSSVESMN